MEPFGKVAKVKLLPKHMCGFICFNARDGAQKALNTLHDKFFVADQPLKLLWAKNQLQDSK
jgi:hypothetical protein